MKNVLPDSNSGSKVKSSNDEGIYIQVAQYMNKYFGNGGKNLVEKKEKNPPSELYRTLQAQTQGFQCSPITLIALNKIVSTISIYFNWCLS